MTAIECVTYIVFAGPMLALFTATCFRMDPCVARPRLARRRMAPRTDENGFPMCVEPDGIIRRPNSRFDSSSFHG